MDDRWLLEHDNRGETYTRPRPDEARVRDVLALFNGSTTFYTCLFDKTDESCLWCVGEPNRRVVEGRVFEGDTIFHFVLRRVAGPAAGTEAVRYGPGPGDVLSAKAAEVLSAAEATAVFVEFFRHKTVPSGFEPVAKAYLFGALSFKD